MYRWVYATLRCQVGLPGAPRLLLIGLDGSTRDLIGLGADPIHIDLYTLREPYRKERDALMRG